MSAKLAVVVPCYRVREHILKVVAGIDRTIARIYVIDDACPEDSGGHVVRHCRDPRVTVIWHPVNKGVGGAVMTGYSAALADGMDIVVKLDGDGQMNPALLREFVLPILEGTADYTKGNRFYDLEFLRTMPRIRLFGNAVLSFMNKLSSGYWDIFDPTNGYTAIHTEIIRLLPLHKISERYFFETDMLFRLNTVRAVVQDVPMKACYGDEVSNLSIAGIIGEFGYKHARNFGKRIFYNYYLRDMSVASFELPVGLLLFLFGVSFGSTHWLQAMRTGSTTPPGTVMLAALPIIMGVQFILAFLSHDINAVPLRVIHRTKSRLGRLVQATNEVPTDAD